MANFRTFSDRQEDQQPAPEPTNPRGCSAYGCPLPGTISDGGAYRCWAHDRLEEPAEGTFLTTGIRQNRWLFQMAAKVSTMTLYDLEKKAGAMDTYLRSQGRDDLVRLAGEKRHDWLTRLRNAAYAKARETIDARGAF